MKYAISAMFVSLMLVGCQSSHGVQHADSQNKAPDLQMDVDLDETDIELIADHIMTLQSEEYARQPS